MEIQNSVWGLSVLGRKDKLEKAQRNAGDKRMKASKSKL